jgi:capsular exopolysaccharide synthesis family protein
VNTNEINKQSQNGLNNNDPFADIILKQPASVFSFDLISLVMKIIKYWYLFFLAFVIAGGIAYLKNKSWTPTYKTATTILIEENRAGIKNDVMSVYSPMGRNLNNQMLMYNSYDFIANTVDKLNLTNEIYIKQRFKNIILYNNSPISIESSYISNQAYAKEFKIEGVDEDTYTISFIGTEQVPAFSQTGKYGVPFQHALFFVDIKKTDVFFNAKYELFFHFFSKNQLIGLYGGRLSSRLLMEGSSVIEISILGKVAQRDIDFLNLLNEQFFQENLDRKNEAADRSIQFIDRQIAIIKDSIDSSEAKLNSYQISSGLYSSQDKSVNKSRVLEDLDQRSGDLRLKKTYLSFLSRSLAQDETELLVDPSATGISSPPLTALITQYNLLVIEMKTLGSGNPIYSRNKKTMEDLRNQMREIMKTMNSAIDIEENETKTRYRKAQGEIASLPKQERKLLTYERDFKIHDTYYAFLLQKRTESQIQKASNAADNLIVDKPRVVAITNGNVKSNHYFIFLLIGFLVPLAFVICKEFLFQFSVQSRDEVEKITKVPMLGTIEKSKRKEQIIVKSHPSSSFAEGFRSLRSRMEYVAQKETPISMLVTSTEPQDGKTFIALNLASIYQLGGKKVIVVDFDLRRPALTKSLNMENNKGLSNCLIGQVSIDEAIVTSEYDFDVLPAGVVPPNPSELIRSQKTKEIIKALYEKYDYIILDCSPAGLVSDAHFLSRLVDVVLYVVRNDKTNKNFLKYTIKELLEDGANNIAVIYNDVNSKSGYYGGKRYYGKGSYYLRHSSYYHNE